MAEQEAGLELKTNRLKEQPTEIWVDYDREIDTFYLFLAKQPQPSIAHYAKDGCYLLFDPDSREIIGFQIEHFVRVFLPKHEELQPFCSRSKRPGVLTRKLQTEPLVAYKAVRNCVEGWAQSSHTPLLLRPA